MVSRGPFSFDSELETLRSRGVTWMVSRNSGGDGARAKIDAARALRIPVVMIARPKLPDRKRVETVADVMTWLAHDACLGA
jgi:precorrin-6A/cobalt-precorrin-6A reductase